MHDLLAPFCNTAILPLADFSMVGLWNGLWPYLVMLLGFSAVVFVHELGHFAMAKWAGVRVDRFAIGFGRELFGVTKGETRYSFNILPLGGYVKMLGQEDFDDKGKELQFNSNPASFINKPVGHRMAIVSAGVIMNVLFACLLFMIVFMIGMEGISKRIGYVEPDSPADKAGLLPGDEILTLNGEKVLEFRDVSAAIQLAPPHVPIEFVVQRKGKRVPPIYVKPDYRRPENTRDVRRQIIGIMPGVTREIALVGPGIDITQPDQPHPGDLIVEVDGVKVTNANVDSIHAMLAYAHEVYVERKDPKHPDAPSERIRVHIQPQIGVYPSDSKDPRTINILGLTPLAQFSSVDPGSRAALAGLEVGDTVLRWADQAYPNQASIRQAIRFHCERDIPFTVRKSSGRIVSGFVRPKQNRYGPATIQAVFETIPAPKRKPDEPSVVFTRVAPFGQAAKSGIERGDRIVSLEGIPNPSATRVRSLILRNTNTPLSLTLRRADGRQIRTVVRPTAPGAIDASYVLIADDVLQTGSIVEQIHGQPSPAAQAGIPAGARIVAVNGQPVSRWRMFIDTVAKLAGTTVDLSLVDTDGERRNVPFRVPHSLRTLLGVGSEARIVSIDGQSAVALHTRRGEEEVQIGYHEGTQTLLASLVGQTNVPVTYHSTPLAPLQTKYIAVTQDMVDPWLGRVVIAPSIEVRPEMFPVKGENAIDAIRIGLQKTYAFVAQVYITIKRMVFSRSIGAENMSGPLGIVSIGGQIARAGLVKFLYFLAIISANLAVINFLPLPIFDGGLMVFLIIEKIKGSPVSLRIQVATQMIGLCLIIGIFLFVTYNDVLRIWG